MGLRDHGHTRLKFCLVLLVVCYFIIMFERSSKKLIFGGSVVIIGFLILLCEYLISYIVLWQCDWPVLNGPKESNKMPAEETSLKVMFLADTHLLGSRKGHWLDKLRREWQMNRVFQTAMVLHNPQIVFVLGDLFDEGLWCSDYEFSSYVKRFNTLFKVPSDTKLYAVVGNHDIGFHYWITPYLEERFVKNFNSPSVQLISKLGVNFVLINSMAMEGDGCYLCRKAVNRINKIARMINCTKGIGKCDTEKLPPGSRPILLQHFPLYRDSDEDCSEPDQAPEDIKTQKFEPKKDCLSSSSTKMLLETLSPRVVLTGHTHHGCYRYHSKYDTHEYTVPSFSWRNKENPSYSLGVFTPNDFAISKCMMPKESTLYMIYLCGVISTLLFISFGLRWQRYSAVTRGTTYEVTNTYDVSCKNE